MIKFFVFLKRRPDLSDADFLAYWLDVHAPLVMSQPQFARRTRRYVVNHAIPGAAIPELTLSDLDGAAEFWFDSIEELQGMVGDPVFLEPVEADLARFADVARTIGLVCSESIQFDRGFGKAKFIGLSRRHPSFTHDEWVRYWIDVHGPLAHGVPEFTRYYGKYVHNYALDEGAEYDGIVEEWLESVEAMAECLAEPKYLEIVRPDELKFVDFARSHMLVTEEHLIYGG